MAVVAQISVQVEVADPGFDERIGKRFVDINNAVHPLQVQHDRTRQPRRRATVRKITPGGNGPERNAVLRGDAQSRADGFDRVRLQRSGGGERRRLAGGERIAVRGEIGPGRHHMLFTHNRAPCGERPVELRL